MKTYVLPKTGKNAQIEILSAADIADVVALHQATRAALPDDKKRYILPQNEAYFKHLLSHETGIMIGIRAEGLLIAQMALKGPLPLRQAIAEQAITHNDVPFHHANLSDSVIVLKSMASHPDWRGNDLAKNLVKYAVESPFSQVCNHMFAQISAGNKRSWDAFIQHKFGIVAAAYDPDDGLPRFIFQRPAFGFDYAADVIADDVDPIADFPAIVSLTQREGLVGTFDEDTVQKLAFYRSQEEESALLQTVARAG